MHVQYFKPRKCYLHPISFIISILVLLLVINVPVYHAKDAHQKYYSDCSKISTFKCGETTLGPIYYPFWGKSIRPSYCGLEGFELTCESNTIPVIDIGTGNKYQVANIDPYASTITLSRYADQFQNTCAPKFNGTRLKTELFEYSPGTEDLYVFYNCPLALDVSVKFEIPDNFTCTSDDDESKKVIFGVKSHLNASLDKLRDSCNPSTMVPANWTNPDKLSLEAKSLLEELLKLSFVVHYRINETACSNCRDSKGVCWNAPGSGVNPECLYKPGKLNLFLHYSKLI